MIRGQSVPKDRPALQALLGRRALPELKELRAWLVPQGQPALLGRKDRLVPLALLGRRALRELKELRA